MIYAVVVMRNVGVEETFADALAGQVKPRTVYVAGMTEDNALAAALDDQKIIDLEEPDAKTLLNFSYSEKIGVEGLRSPSSTGNTDRHDFEDILAYAKNRVAQLQRMYDKGE